MRKKIATCALLTAMLAAETIGATSAAARDQANGPAVLELSKGSILHSWAASDSKGNPIDDVTVRTETTPVGERFVFSSKSREIAVTCGQISSPAPTYSWSNHTMFWGSKITCTAPSQTRFRAVLWSGPTDDNITTWQDRTPRDGSWSHKIDWTHDIAGSRPCVDWGYFTWWKLYSYAEVSWNFNGVYTPFVPYPGESPKRYQECVDIQ